MHTAPQYQICKGEPQGGGGLIPLALFLKYRIGRAKKRVPKNR